MSDDSTGSNFQLLNEECSITGGKSVSEIVQILRTNANLKLKVRDFESSEDAEEQPNKTSQIFPWVKKITTQCKEIIPDPTIKKLDDLIITFLKHVEDSVKECYKRPKRAHKLKTRIFSFLLVFNMIYGQLKQPLEHASYLDKMSDVMALYIDIELKSSKRGREHPKKISERICTSLFVFLDKSIEHMLDTVLKAKFFIKKYSDICCPIMARLLKEKPGLMYETTYVRYLLSFKLWKKLAGKDSYPSINDAAVAKLVPPSDFVEKLKTGLFANVLPYPYVSKSEKDRITLFFMQSPFNVKKKAQVFLKGEKKMTPNFDLEKSIILDDDLQINSFFDDDDDESINQPNMLMNDIWKNLVDKEDDCFDPLFTDMMDSKEDENVIFDLKKTKHKDKPKRTTKDKASNGLLKTSMKKRKALKVNNNNIMKNISNKDIVMDLIRSDLTKPLSSVKPEEEVVVVSSIKIEDSPPSIMNSPDSKISKPCATVEPEQCKEITDSLNNVTEVLPIKIFQNPTTSNSVLKDTAESASEQSCTVETSSASGIVPSPDLAVVNPIISNVDSHVTAPTTTVESSGIHEDFKADTLSKDLFDEPSNTTFKIGKPEDARILEENYVAEEVVISSDMEHDSACTFFLLDSDVKIDQADIMNVIGITRDSTAFCSDEIEVQTESCTRDQEKQQIALGSLLDSQSLSSSDQKSTQKENSSVSPENQYLSSIIASTETNENYVSLLRRQDSYTCNEMFLQRLFSDPTPVDEGSDDDSRYQNRRRFVSGGKIPAFREHIEDSKSDNEEDFEPLTPSSDSQQPSPMDTSTSLDMNLQSATLESSPPDSDLELKTLQNPVIDKISPHLDKRSEKKFVQQDHRQIKELSVHMSLGDVVSANEHILNKEKSPSKGTFEPPVNILHFQTVDCDTKYEHLQFQLYNLYLTVENILDTDPVPYPRAEVTRQSIDGYMRCPCIYCVNNYVRIVENYQRLHNIRTGRILEHVDKLRMSKILESKVEDEKLLKSIEDSIAQQSSEELNKNTSTFNTETDNGKIDDVSKEDISMNNNSDTEAIDIETVGNLETVENRLKNYNKSEYASLPPKKRKAFSVEQDSNHSSKVLCKSIHKDFSYNNNPNVDCEKRLDKSVSKSHVGKIPHENSLPPGEASQKVNPSSIEDSNRSSSVKIKTVGEQYCVLNDTSSISTEKPSSCNTNEDIPKSGKKKCHRRRSKEEKRLRKEQKRLEKKLKKQKREERLLN